MARKYHTASGKNGSNHPPHTPNYSKELLYHGKDRMVFETLRAIRDLSNKEAAEGACSAATIRAWRIPPTKGGTKYPRAITMNAVLHRHGKRLGVVDL